ncbi:MAG: hypothetical protein U9Q80_00890 [Bacillota bacterium]|nr:hypothetical protein [Bacillota bacterium]
MHFYFQSNIKTLKSNSAKILKDNSEDEDIVSSPKEAAIEYIKANPTVDNYGKIND